MCNCNGAYCGFSCAGGCLAGCGITCAISGGIGTGPLAFYGTSSGTVTGSGLAIANARA